MRREIHPEAFLANLPLFSGLPRDELARLAAGTRRRKLVRGEILFRQGEPPSGIHVLVYGRIKLSARGPDGRERLVDLVDEGQSFGEPVLFLGKPYIVTASALADALVLEVGRDAVQAELAHNPRFAARIIGALARRVESLVRELHEQALATAAQRFVAWMLRRGPFPASQPAIVSLPAAKRVLAARLKISAEHLSRILHELRDEGLIRVRGREVEILDVERLAQWQRESAAEPSSRSHS